MGLYRWVVRRAGTWRWLRPAATKIVPRIDTALLHRGWHATPFPTLLLTTTGAHSGRPHEAPLWYLENGTEITVVATNFGRREPDWSRNLTAHPLCTITIGKDTHAAHARLAEGADAARRFDAFADFYPTYRDYAARARRDIPVWVLSRLPGARKP